jgi:dihydroflavonol-4-reductase
VHIFVTGGNGFIGSAVVRKLLDDGHRVRCLMREKSDDTRIRGLGAERVLGDVRDRDSVKRGMLGCEAVIHLASLSNWNDIHSPLMKDVVITGSRNVITSAMSLGNLRTVFVSSAAAINGTKEPTLQHEKSPFTLDLDKYVYAKAKIAVENICKRAHQQNLPIVIVNPGEVYGPKDTSLNTAGNLIDFAKSRPVITCKGGTSIVHVDDVANGICAALHKGKPGERYILGGDNLTVTELAQLTLKLLGKKTVVLQLPNWLLSSAAFIADTLRLPFPVNPKVVPYATRFWMMDNHKARTQLGVSFRNATETLESTLAWLCDAKYI